MFIELLSIKLVLWRLMSGSDNLGFFASAGGRLSSRGVIFGDDLAHLVGKGELFGDSKATGDAEMVARRSAGTEICTL
jgi:hypothetical protein